MGGDWVLSLIPCWKWVLCVFDYLNSLKDWIMTRNNDSDLDQTWVSHTIHHDLLSHSNAGSTHIYWIIFVRNTSWRLGMLSCKKPISQQQSLWTLILLKGSCMNGGLCFGIFTMHEIANHHQMKPGCILRCVLYFLRVLKIITEFHLVAETETLSSTSPSTSTRTTSSPAPSTHWNDA